MREVVFSPAAVRQWKKLPAGARSVTETGALDLAAHGSAVIAKKGRPCAVLLPVTEETDLETLLLCQRKEFREVLCRAHEEGPTKGFTKLADLPG